MNAGRLKTLMVSAVVSFGSIVCTGSEAATVVIDFDAAPPASLTTADYLEDGVLMRSVSGHYDILLPGLNRFTTRYLSLDIRPLVGETVSAVRFSSTGGLFDLLSIDVGDSTSPGFGTQQVTSSAGGQRFLEFAGTEMFSGAAWSNLSWIDLAGSVPILGPGFDNITLNTAVPVPPALLLLGSGLAGLAWVGRIRRRPGQASSAAV